MQMNNTNNALTSTACLSRIFKHLKDNGVSDKMESVLSAEFAHLQAKMNVNPMQSVIIACILESSYSRCGTTSKQICNILGCTNIEFLNYSSELDELMRRRMVRPAPTTSVYTESNGYILTKMVIDAIKHDAVLEQEPVSELTSEEFFDRVYRLFSEQGSGQIKSDELKGDIEDLVKNNEELPFCKALAEINFSLAEEVEYLMFIYMCSNYVIQGVDTLAKEEIIHLVEPITSFGSLRQVFTAIKHQRLVLQKNGLIEPGMSNGMVDNDSIMLTEKAKETFFVDMGIELDVKGRCPDLVRPEDIKVRELYYNPTDGKQVERLAGILDQEHFREIQSRLEAASMRKGFNCIFYGAPGTGKTETVYQLARESGRDILPVDLGKMKSKWVGESERTVRSVFSYYQWLVKKCERAPILLFNEADGIFGLRARGAESSVDKMNNTIQNIILQEMERMEGIMIATTNLTENLDPAFERRFLYKVEFTVPEVETRAKIWKSMMPFLPEQAAYELARKYPFSGGHIENISRKCVVEYILIGNDMTLEEISTLCEQESYSNSRRTRIGF